MCPMAFNYYAIQSLKLQLAIIFTYVVRFEHMTCDFNRLNLKICLIAFSCRSNGQKQLWFKSLIQVSCTLSVFRILICENLSLCQGQNKVAKLGVNNIPSPSPQILILGKDQISLCILFTFFFQIVFRTKTLYFVFLDCIQGKIL